MQNLLIYGDSERNADLYYETKMLVPDPFIYLRLRGIKIIFLSKLEYGRGKKEAQVDEVHLMESSVLDSIISILKKKNISEIHVPSTFPLFLADALRKRRVKVTIKADPFIDDRLTKTANEIRAMRDVLRDTEWAMGYIIDLIKKTRVKNGKVGSLTSELLKFKLNAKLLERNAYCEHPIIACGDHACDPHNRGSGPILANSAIIIDVFPKSLKSFYFADITRTIVKGRPSDRLRRMYEAVLKAQKIGIKKIRAGVLGTDVNAAVQESFKQSGWETKNENGIPVGFIHSTGHGLGLEIHEFPGLGRSKSKDLNLLKPDHVVTVEPGLYYPGLGGIRIEDTVVVKKGGCENLTRFPKFFDV